MVPFPVRIYYESATYGSAISHRRSSVRARAPGLIRRLVCDIVRVAEPLSTQIGPQLICSPGTYMAYRLRLSSSGANAPACVRSSLWNSRSDLRATAPADEFTVAGRSGGRAGVHDQRSCTQPLNQ